MRKFKFLVFPGKKYFQSKFYSFLSKTLRLFPHQSDIPSTIIITSCHNNVTRKFLLEDF